MGEEDWLEPRPEHARPWQVHAACRGDEGSLFFPPDKERRAARSRREARAKAVCEGCPVLDVCREHALRVEEPSGIWGGLTEDERVQVLAMSHQTTIGERVG